MKINKNEKNVTENKINNEPNINELINDIENSLRNFISFALDIKYGANWIEELKISKDRIKCWNDKMQEELKKMKGSTIEKRLIYYSDFYDLQTIIFKYWDDVFKEAFYDKKEMEVFLDIIISYRNAIAYNRKLLQHQKKLLIGICGRIKYMITEYRADKDNEDSYYPKIQNVLVNGFDICDSFESYELSKKHYHIDDEIEAIVNVISPPYVSVKYSIFISNKDLYDIEDFLHFDNNNNKIIKLSKNDVPNTNLYVFIKSDQEFHRFKNIDGREEYMIRVLPNK